MSKKQIKALLNNYLVQYRNSSNAFERKRNIFNKTFSFKKDGELQNIVLSVKNDKAFDLRINNKLIYEDKPLKNMAKLVSKYF